MEPVTIVLLVVNAVLVLAVGYLVKLARRGGGGSADVEARLERLSDRINETLRTSALDTQTRLGQAFDGLKTAVNTDLATGRKESADTLGRVTRALEERFEKLQASNEERLERIQTRVQAGLDATIEKSQTAFSSMTERLGDLKATSARIAEFSKDLSELQKIFKSPKLRGATGEFSLENMLAQLLPAEHYDMQYTIAPGCVADAVIHLKGVKLCIDAKFPMEDFQRMTDAELSDADRKRTAREFERNVSKKVDSIAEKYIVPGVTLDYAFMFVPAEAVYYEIIQNTDLHRHALDRRVLPVSPNSFFAYLQSIAIGFRGMKIEESARHMEQIILQMKKDFDRFKDDFATLGRHLSNARSKFEDAQGDVNRFDTTIGSLQVGELESPPAAALPEGGEE